MADFYKSHEDLVKGLEKKSASLNEMQTKIVDVLCENVDNIPPNFFEVKTIDQLNDWFGAHDDVVIDEDIVSYMKDFMEYNTQMKEMVYALGVLEGGDENEKTDSDDTPDLTPEQKEIYDRYTDWDMIPKGFFDDIDKVNEEYGETMGVLDEQTGKALQGWLEKHYIGR